MGMCFLIQTLCYNQLLVLYVAIIWDLPGTIVMWVKIANSLKLGLYLYYLSILQIISLISWHFFGIFNVHVFAKILASLGLNLCVFYHVWITCCLKNKLVIKRKDYQISFSTQIMTFLVHDLDSYFLFVCWIGLCDLIYLACWDMSHFRVTQVAK